MNKNWTEHDIISGISRINTVYKQHGDEIILQICPYCGKSDYKFYINIKKQAFICQHKVSCNKRGTVYKLFSDLNILPQYPGTNKKIYSTPKADDSIFFSEEFLEKYEKTRGISKEILKKYCVGQKAEFIVYRYIDENGIEKNRKYRTFDKSKIWTEKDCEPVYYGLNHINFTEKQLLVVSGEDDCHALIQMELTNVVSVPYGDGTYTDAMHKINQRFEQIILLFDADEAGQAGALKFALKAGVQKCLNVVLPFKDARDCLISGIEFFDIQAEIAKATTFRLPELPGAWNITQLSPKRFLEADPPKFEWIIKDVIAKGLAGFIYGEGGTFKSLAALWLVLQRACADIRADQLWLNKFPVSFGRSIFFSAEDVELDLHHRVKTISKVIGSERFEIPESAIFERIGKNCLVVPREKWVSDGEVFIVDEDGKKTDKVNKIINLINEYRADLVVVETYSRVANVDEIDNRTASRVIGTLEDIRDSTSATILCIAHSSKAARRGESDIFGQNGLRGAGALIDNARFGIWFKAKKGENGTNLIEIMNSKNFRTKRFESFCLLLEYPSFKIVEKTDAKLELEERVIEYVKNNPGCTQRSIRQTLKCDSTKLCKVCKELVLDGVIELRMTANKPDGYYYADTD